MPDASAIKVLRYLPEQSDPAQAFPAFSSRSAVSSVLNWKDDVCKTHIRALGRSVDLSPAAFFETMAKPASQTSPW